MFKKSWQVNEQVPELINVSDFPDELTATGNKSTEKVNTPGACFVQDTHFKYHKGPTHHLQGEKIENWKQQMLRTSTVTLLLLLPCFNESSFLKYLCIGYIQKYTGY